jgi:hypothetical protein
MMYFQTIKKQEQIMYTLDIWRVNMNQNQRQKDNF